MRPVGCIEPINAALWASLYTATPLWCQIVILVLIAGAAVALFLRLVPSSGMPILSRLNQWQDAKCLRRRPWLHAVALIAIPLVTLYVIVKRWLRHNRFIR